MLLSCMTALDVLPPSRAGLFEQVASQIEELVLTGRLEVGTKLPSEGELASQFRVSRPVIREALAQLRERRLLETINGAGTFVRHPDSDHLADVLLRHLRFETLARPQVIESLYEARMAVEVMAARLAAIRATDANQLAMAERLRAMKAATDDPEGWIAADMGFHLAIADASHNAFFGIFLSPLTQIIQASMSESRRNPDAVRSGLAAHEAILCAIEAHDEEVAARAMLDHLRDSKERLAAVLVLPGRLDHSFNVGATVR